MITTAYTCYSHSGSEKSTQRSAYAMNVIDIIKIKSMQHLNSNQPSVKLAI